MNTYEQLAAKACDEGIDIMEYHFESDNIRGLYCDNVIAISRDIKSIAERTSVLAEEIGHHCTSYGNIIELDTVGKRKQEYQARLFAYNYTIGLEGIISAYKAGCRNSYEAAEHLNITEAHLMDCLNCYKEKYGICAHISNYAIYFIPNLAVIEII